MWQHCRLAITIPNNMDIVNEVLAKSQEEAKKYKSTHVDKHLELYYDLGTLLAIDENELDLKKLKSSPDSYLQALARDNTQCLINKLWELPTETVDDVTVAVLPPPKYILPRAQPLPKPKAPTKWEQFAKEKGIQKKKKDKLKWDDILQKWVPLHGFQRAKAEKEKDWVIEVPESADPMEDQFTKKTASKKEKVAKNEFQRLRNLAKAKNIKIPKVGFAPTPKPSASTLGAALTVAKASTASLGKFQEKLPKEKPSKHVKEFLPETRKRKLPALKPAEEKKKSIEVIDNILNKKPKIVLDKAIDDEVHKENREENSRKKQKRSSKKGQTKKGGKGGKFRGPQESKAGTKKGKSRPRVRVGGKQKGGRKRR